jgi:hypothetical protein
LWALGAILLSALLLASCGEGSSDDTEYDTAVKTEALQAVSHAFTL